ncbi:hypothetical protein QYM36_006233 [Artemia franciscana]|uniref:Small integral membrane protein 20 n=1 Tax=Artemia franciscana TaxID=6661 RepID=A0AA88I8V1_ARTSF|nr:hypothetical protein QYM36_006233 [Artemia franciscana]
MSYRMSGWKYGAFIGGIVGFIGLALYPTVIYPMQHIDEYKEIQKSNRAGIIQENIQPGGIQGRDKRDEGDESLKT